MNRFPRIVLGGALVFGLLAASFTIANTQQASEEPPMQLPPGWSVEDMKTCMEAAEPGEMHAFLASSVGTWNGKATSWIAPNVEPMHTQNTATVTSIMNGRFVKVEWTGDWPGVGTYKGLALYGYDNVTEKFQGVWIEDHTTTMAIGTGDLSSDGRILTWKFTYSCPLREKPVTLRQVERITGEDEKMLEMFASCPKSGREFKMMEVQFERK